MLRIIGIMLSGVLIGYILRNKNLGFISKLIAFILSAGATLGSAACAWIVYRFLWLKKKP